MKNGHIKSSTVSAVTEKRRKRSVSDKDENNNKNGGIFKNKNKTTAKSSPNDQGDLFLNSQELATSASTGLEGMS